ncbi:hypothetical protein HNQ50_003981 [Silvimonas terrae]|uniref:ABC-type transport auxiliary lipoprotein component domain-containing protein n=1 Tax=Silvimonas terrae TaxID=300266 RepID=A0A840RJE4_9NEIS|nr:hypothetical protein [Silvimonas terrae]MBB5193227.1 hypothetical protein [Silvimonas terrae]
MKKLCAVLALGLAGCVSTEPVTLHAKYQPAPVSHDSRDAADTARATVVARHCPMILTPVQDTRPAGENLGGFLRSDNIHAEDLSGWVQSGFMSLPQTRYQLSTTETAGTSRLQVQLRKAYFDTVTTSRVANIVLKLQVQDPDGKVRAQTTLRGTDVSVNWANSESDANSGFNVALKNLLDQADGFLDHNCQAGA